jgi:virulence-associated protein VapD
MKANIYVQNGPIVDEFNVNAHINNAAAFDGLYADVIEIREVRLHSAKDVDDFIKQLQVARLCFRLGNQSKDYLKP